MKNTIFIAATSQGARTAADPNQTPIHFEFKPLNEIVEISSMERDFSNKVICDIRRKVKNGEIRYWKCFTNAVVVAEVLVKDGVSGVSIIDGYYTLKGDTPDAHRFIKHTSPDGRVRYYDPTLEFLPKMPPASYYVHHAMREFELPVMQRFGRLAFADGTESGFTCNDPETLFQTTTLDYFLCPHATIGDNGDFVPILSVCKKYGFPMPEKQAA